MRVAIADGAALFHEGVVRLLVDAGITVITSVDDGAKLTSAIVDDPPDAAILDIRMPPTHTTEGLDAARAIRHGHPEIGVLLLSQHVETRHVADLLHEGGRIGYLLKERVADTGELTEAFRRIHAGGSRPLDDPGTRGTRPHGGRTVQLCHRRPARADPKTVESHIGRILTKLDLPPVTDDNRRVLAVLTHLRAEEPSS